MWSHYLTRVQVPGLRGLTEETECKNTLMIILQQKPKDPSLLFTSWCEEQGKYNGTSECNSNFSLTYHFPQVT